jgi:hypothetical protein
MLQETGFICDSLALKDFRERGLALVVPPSIACQQLIRR